MSFIMLLFAIAYLGGALTVLSPCILPVLPFVFAQSKGRLPMLAGMALTFAAFASLATVGGFWVVTATDYGRYAAMALLLLFGLTLLSASLADYLARPFVALGNTLTGHGGSLILGIATGLLWTPCAGPILGLILTGAALHGANGQTALLLVTYAAGAATSMAVALRIAGVLKRWLGLGEWLRRAAGVAVLAGVALIATGADTGALAQVGSADGGRLEKALVETTKEHHSRLPVEGELPPLSGATAWLNGDPLAVEQLRGKVVLVDFWTYSCINCIRSLPYVEAWAEKYKDQGLVVIGVHTPEFAFEKKVDNVKGAIGEFKISYPVAVDSNYRIWNAFENQYWPAEYLIDAKGKIRHHEFGEGGYAEMERAIQDLLAEANNQSAAGGLVAPDAKGVHAAADISDIRSPETDLGYRHTVNFASRESLRQDAAQSYTVGEPRLNHWGFKGNWTVGAEAATLNDKDGSVVYRFSARDLHLVLGATGGQPVRFRVSIDGKAPGDSHGTDIDADGFGLVGRTRLYQLVRQAGKVEEHTFEIRFLDPGAEAFSFTFG
jgi:cytochrome c biogenesis protein CcdA/thiol-disulfide isomerase/thioredoxin